MSDTLIVGTRSSQLAMVQTERAVAELKAANPALSFKIHKVTTSGDKDQTSFLSTLRNTQFFTKELDDALLAGEIDLAVHSLKDIVLEMPDGIALAATLKRDEHRDALVTPDGRGLMDLPRNATLGTGSVRRRAFLRRVRPDIQFAEIRGNLNTRMRKLDEGQYHGIVLAGCGLQRLGWGHRIAELLPVEIILPAAGQGAIAVTVRDRDTMAADAVSAINHKPTYMRTHAERLFLGALTASCRFPLGVLATLHGNDMTITAEAWSPDADDGIQKSITGPAADYQDMAAELADYFKANGVDSLVSD